jgi:RNA polymerase sigma-70 factor, ECF subfamily
MQFVPDEQLMSRVAAGDEAAFAELYDRHAARVLGFLVRMLGRQDDAEDVLQETFWQVWKQAGDFDPSRASAKGWLYLLARSRATDLLRRRRREPAQLDAETPSPTAAPLEGLEAQDDGRALADALTRLTPEQRLAIQEAFYGGLTYEEVARRASLPVGTVKTRIRTGMQRLRDILKEPTAVRP